MLATFFRFHSNSKEISYLLWQNKYPNLKATCHVKPKFFLWTQLPKNLLLAKYLSSVTAALIRIWYQFCGLKCLWNFWNPYFKYIHCFFYKSEGNWPETEFSTVNQSQSILVLFLIKPALFAFLFADYATSNIVINKAYLQFHTHW